jgi:hypothetical protein
MKRRFFFMLVGLALIASFALGSPSGARANDGCSELDSAIEYHVQQHNWAYVMQLLEWGREAECGSGQVN